MNTGAACIEINEVGPRDGLQIEKAFVPTEEKLSWSMRYPNVDSPELK